MESLLQDAGHCGKFQVCHVTLVQMCRFVTVWGQGLMIFGLYNPGWRCSQTNLTPTTNRSRHPVADSYSLTPDQELGLNFQSLSNTSFFRSPTNATNTVQIIYYNGSCDVIDSCANGIEFNPESSSIISRFGLVCDKVWIAVLIVSVLNAGMLVGAFAGGQIGERFGRKVGLYACNLFMAINCALAVLSPRWEVYAFFMFFIGLGSVGVIATLSSLCMEFLDTKWRARVGSVPVWNVSLILFAVTCAILKDWRYLHLTSAFLIALASLGFFWIPESLRWLVVHGKTSQAEKVVTKMCKLNNRAVPTEPLSQLMAEFDSEQTDKKYTYLDLLRTREIRILTVKLTCLWVIATQVYDVLGYGIQALPGDFYTNIIILSIAEFPGVLINGWLANKLGRRPTGIFFASIGVLSCSVIVIALLFVDSNSSVRDHLITSMAFVNRSSIQATLCFMVAYSSELVPTAVRNLAFGFFNLVSRTVGVVAAILLPRDPLSMIICFAVLMASQLIAACVFFSLAETKGKPLTDMMNALEKKHSAK